MRQITVRGLQSEHGSRGLQCRYSPLKDIVCKLRYIVANILWRNDQIISITTKYAPLSYRKAAIENALNNR